MDCGNSHGSETTDRDDPHLSDGNRTETIADVTDIFRNFNADKLTPLTVTGSLYAPVGAEPDGTIIDWKPGNGDGSDVDANM